MSSDRPEFPAVPTPDTAPVIVIGMHRSGTSLLARLLNDLGVHMGRELDVHHESVLFKEANKELLGLAGAHWARPEPFISALDDDGFLLDCQRLAMECLRDGFGTCSDESTHRLWGWKDPRNTLTLPIWLGCLGEAKVIHIVRNGFDVAMSVSRREYRRWVNKSTEKRMFPPTLGASYRLWETYVELGLSHVRAHDSCLTLRYEDLLADSGAQLRRVVDFADVETDPVTIAAVARERIARPRRPGRWSRMWLRLLVRRRYLNGELLSTLGYRL